MKSLGALVLSGGKSARFGSDKALATLDGETFLERVVRATSVHCAEVVVVCAPGSLVPALPAHVRVFRDPVPHSGPLVAIAHGVCALSPAITQVFVAATDLPWLEPALVRRLAELALGHDAAIPVVGGAPQLVCAVYTRASCERALGLVASGSRSMRALASAIDARLVSTEELLEDSELARADPKLASLSDVDTRAELARRP